MALQAVIFDIDGTLYPNRAMFFRSAGFFITHLRLIRHFSIVRKDLRRVGKIEDFEATQAGMLAARMKISPHEAEKRIHGILYGRWERCFRHIRPCRGLDTVLEMLTLHGIRLGILSDFPVGNKLRYLGLQDIPWEVTLSSRDSGYLKPSIRPFLYAAERMGLLPEDILYVGNNYHYDVVGSSKAGMKTAWFTGNSRGRTADLIFRNYREFGEKIRSLFDS